MTEAGPKHEAASRTDRALRVLLPFVVLGLGVVLWGAVVRWRDIPPYVLPGPGLVFATLVADWAMLSEALIVTLTTTLQGFALAAVGGIGLAVLFNQSRLIEYSLYPYAVILQVTPIVAIAPLLLVYLPQPAAVLACAWIVAFFPVLANTTLGLNSVDRNLADLFRLYGATRRQVLWELKLPAALPYILGGLKIAGGLSLIGAVVAEIAAGSAGAGSGLAYRIVEAGYRLNIPRMFAALLLLSLAGIVIFFALSLVSHLLLRRWHESALAREVERAPGLRRSRALPWGRSVMQASGMSAADLRQPRVRPRGSILFRKTFSRRGWIAGSSPAMPAVGDARASVWEACMAWIVSIVTTLVVLCVVPARRADLSRRSRSTSWCLMRRAASPTSPRASSAPSSRKRGASRSWWRTSRAAMASSP